ncbi:MAG: NifB/NifX family molybdenum-iron cluster-binding protein [Bacteroidota bacterium]
MKIAIASTGNSLESKIDPRFGRCSYFVIYDTDSEAVEFVPNKSKDAEDGAGPASVQFVAGKNVQKIVSGEFGIKIKPMLDQLKIQMIVVKDNEKKIKDIIEMLNHKN